jgi:hypothetical protein
LEPGFSGSTPWNQTVSLQKRANFAGPPAGFRGPQNTHAEGMRVSQLRKRATTRKIGVRFFGVIPLKSDDWPPKTVNICGPPRRFRGPQNTHAEGVRVSQRRKRTTARKIGVRFVGVDPLESDSLTPKPVKFCGALLLFPRPAKHSRRGHEGFPAEKKGRRNAKLKSCFRGRPREIRQFQTVCLQKRSNLCGPPLPISEGRKTLTPRA